MKKQTIVASEVSDKWINNELSRYDVKELTEEQVQDIYNDITARYGKHDADWFMELVEASKNIEEETVGVKMSETHRIAFSRLCEFEVEVDSLSASRGYTVKASVAAIENLRQCFEAGSFKNKLITIELNGELVATTQQEAKTLGIAEKEVPLYDEHSAPVDC